MPLTLLVLLAINVLVSFVSYRIDLTADKRYTISKPTKALMQKLDAPVNITIYLDGDLNAGFLRLKRATAELLDDLSSYGNHAISCEFVNPSDAETVEMRNKQYEDLVNEGMSPTVIYEKTSDGQSTQKVIFPWAKVQYKSKTRYVLLLKNMQGNSGEQNLNISIETLEYEFTDVLRTMSQTKVNKIAFIEGHGELPEHNTFDVSTALSKYFQIDRGILGDDPRILNDYKAIIVAGPQEKFSESDKFIIDQYIMQGGRVLWMLDGVRMDANALSTSGISPAIPLDLNLTDQLFRYGVRINPVILQDEQCMLIPVNTGQGQGTSDFQPMPWYFAPLLNTSPFHAATRNVTALSSNFVSAIDFVGNDTKLRKEVLLATSSATHVIATPGTIDVNSVSINPNHFNQTHIPVGVAVEGVFQSVFAHRMKPDNLLSVAPIRKESVPTKQIVLASGTIMSNDYEHGQALPAGYDRYTQKQFGNRDFVVNALLYLADDEGWIDLRNKEFTLRLLNKSITRRDRRFYQYLNVGTPLCLLLLFGIGFMLWRKRKYGQSES